MATSEPTVLRRSRGVEVRDKLIRAAGRMLAQRGYDGCSVIELASAAGLSKNHIFNYFLGKEALALAALERALEELSSEVAAPSQAFSDPLQRAQFILRKLGELGGPASAEAQAGGNPLRLLAALASGHAALPPVLAKRVSAALDELLKLLREPLKASRTGPRGDAPRARDLAQAMLGALLGAAVLQGAGVEADAGPGELLGRLLAQV